MESNLSRRGVHHTSLLMLISVSLEQFSCGLLMASVVYVFFSLSHWQIHSHLIKISNINHCTLEFPTELTFTLTIRPGLCGHAYEFAGCDTLRIEIFQDTFGLYLEVPVPDNTHIIHPPPPPLPKVFIYHINLVIYNRCYCWLDSTKELLRLLSLSVPFVVT